MAWTPPHGVDGRGAVAVLVLSLAACSSAGGSPRKETITAAERPQPNLLFILDDQHRRDAVGAYGNRLIRTPHLDALAQRSVLFEAAYVTQPLCTPSRASLLTGLYPHTHRAALNNEPLSPDPRILTQMLPPGVYRAAWFGKWHLGDEIFRQRGFDEFESTEDGYEEHYSEGRDRSARSGYHHFLAARGVKPDRPDGYSRAYANRLPKELSKPAYVAGKGIGFIERHRDRPFVVFLSFLDPHTPFNSVNDGMYDPAQMEVPATFHEPLDPTVLERTRVLRELLQHNAPGDYRGIVDTPRDLQEVKARYWGKVTLVDEMIGRVLRRLGELGLADQTIVVFTSDHGELMGDHRLMFKSLLYEEAAAVPLLLSVPRLTDGGRRVSAAVSNVDVTPTLLELMGETAPPGLQGESWAPLLRGGGQWPERPVFMQFNGPPWPFEDRFTERLRSVLTPGRWKLTVDDRSQGELYDLRQDPQERKNLFYDEAQLDRVRALLEEIRSWQRRTGDEVMRFDEAEWRRHGRRLRQAPR
jgi:arylsulfatase A-like enzyme